MSSVCDSNSTRPLFVEIEESRVHFSERQGRTAKTAKGLQPNNNNTQASSAIVVSLPSLRIMPKQENSSIVKSVSLFPSHCGEEIASYRWS